ncbi:MAG: DUF4065 domain-containing protein [Clostridia bacterium]|nr:DUF4065 domain-containing protein [Clostridia bacterium]
MIWKRAILALQKMLYYAQGFYKAFTNNYLFDDDCQAWTHGPVYNTIYTEYKENGTRKGLKSDEPSKRIISKKFIKEYFNDVKEKFNMINYYDIKRYSMNMFNNIIE